MKLTQAQQTLVLTALVVVLVFLIGYRIMTGEKPKTAPLTYQRGAVASSPVRQGTSSRREGADPLSVFLQRRGEKYPGVARDIFRMENPAPQSAVSHLPPVHVKTPEEIAAEAAKAAADAAAAATQSVVETARADLSKFQFLGYLTEKDSTLFLSKDGELFIVKKGSNILKSYKVKEASRNYVILLDTITGVEVRLELPGGELAPQQAPQQAPPQQPLTQIRRLRNIRPALVPKLEPSPGPAPGTVP